MTGEQALSNSLWIGFVDEDMQPVELDAAGLFVDVQAMDGEQASRLKIGASGGDLFAASEVLWKEIRLLTMPTPVRRFATGQEQRWRLLSQATVNSLLLTNRGVEALKDILDLYDLPRSPANQRLRDGLIAIECSPLMACINDGGFSSLVRGTAIKLAVDEPSFADVGLRLFGEVLGRFFALSAQANSFTKLSLTSSRTGAVLFVDERRVGAKPLI